MTGALFIFLAGAAAAQDPGPVEITLSGQIQMTGASRDRVINEAALWTPGGLPAGNPIREHDTFVLPEIALRFDVSASSVRAALELGNAVLHDDAGDPRFQEDRLGDPASVRIRLLQGWLEFWDRLRIGQQDFLWDPTGLGRPLFLAPSRCESPWGELPDSTVPPFPASGTNTLPQTRRDRLFPVGAVARLDDLTLFALLLAEGGPPSADEGLYGAAWSGSFDVLRLGAVATLMTGGLHDQALGTGGLVASLDLDPFRMVLEGYAQTGRAGDHLQAGGNAFRAAARYGRDAWVEAVFLRVSGDSRGDDGREGRFLSYEDNDATLIVEGNEFGLDIDTNYCSAQISAGGSLRVFEAPLRPRLTAAWFRFLEAIPLPPDSPSGTGSRSRALGVEVDATLELDWSERLTFYVAGAGLFQAGALEEVTRSRDDRAFLLTLGLRSTF